MGIQCQRDTGVMGMQCQRGAGVTGMFAVGMSHFTGAGGPTAGQQVPARLLRTSGCPWQAVHIWWGRALSFSQGVRFKKKKTHKPNPILTLNPVNIEIRINSELIGIILTKC